MKFFIVDALNILHSNYKMDFQTEFNTPNNETECCHLIEFNCFSISITELTVFKFNCSNGMEIAYKTGIIICFFT